MLSHIDLGPDRVPRMAFFARRALAEAVAGTNLPAAASCILVVPRNRDGIDYGREVWRQLEAEQPIAPAPGTRRLPRVVALGRAGFFHAARDALRILAPGTAPAVVVVAVDSGVDDMSLHHLVAANRALGPSNPDGICPGEGAVCVVLAAPGSVAPANVLGRVSVLSTAIEPFPFEAAAGQGRAGHGLAHMFAELGAHARGRVDEVFGGITTEAYYGREFSHAYLRTAGLMPEPLRFEAVAAAFGDLGAAAGAMAFGYALAAVNPGSRRPAGHTALAYGSSDTGCVGGCVVRRP